MLKPLRGDDMVDLLCTPFVELIDRMRLEFRNQRSVFDLPLRNWFRPPTDDGSPDLSVRFHESTAANPVGPASGPHTQMAQNLVLAWLAGARIFELKTVQINDRLEIPRPCIDAANVGYNVEWSQELRVEESLDQYVQGAMLIHLLRAAPGEFGLPQELAALGGPAGDFVFDMSIGYDLAGIQSDKICNFIRGMIDARESVERLRGQLPERLAALRDLEFPTRLSRSITLSTFHGCPADEIERICEFTLTELGVHTIVKMNPPMLGKERLEHLLHERMGYQEIRVNPEAYSSGLRFDQSIEICRRLSHLAGSLQLGFGAKFSNTLEVVNHRDFFPPSEEVMYLSGAPLHVITLTLADEFRRAAPADMPISFSAGVDRHNFANLVACGFTPITTCTDLLKTGGYGRLPPYLQELEKAMRVVGAATIGDFILDYRGQREAAGGDPGRAGLLNTELIARETRADQRYRADRNRGVPRKIGSHLVMFDCVTCDKCIPVCPNDANFAYPTGDIDHPYRDVEVSPDGEVRPVGDELRFRLEKREQIANFADYCNHCGNCDTFCPEYDGPYLKKPSFFGSRAGYELGAPHDGFLVEGEPGALRLTGRIDGREYRVEQLPAELAYRYTDGGVTLLMDGARPPELEPGTDRPAMPHRVDMGRFHAVATLLRGIVDPGRIHAVNAPLLASDGAGAESEERLE